MSLPSATELKDPRSPHTGYSAAFLIFSAVALQAVASLCYPIAKYGLEFIEPFTFAFYRYLFSSVVLLAFVKFRKHKIPVERKDYKKIILLGFLIIPFNQTLFLVGQSMTAAGHGAFLFATTPVFIFVLALILLSGALEVSTEYLLGDIIILVSVTAWAYYTIIGKNLVRKYGALRMTAYALASGSALYFPFGLYMAAKFDYSQVTLAAWGSVLYMALGLSVFVYVVWYWLLKYMEASRIAVYHNIQPVIATIVAYIFLGETLTVPFIIGGLIVLAGVITSET